MKIKNAEWLNIVPERLNLVIEPEMVNNYTLSAGQIVSGKYSGIFAFKKFTAKHNNV